MRKIYQRFTILAGLVTILAVSGCRAAAPLPSATLSPTVPPATAVPSATATITLTVTATATQTPTATFTPTITNTPTITLTPTITQTPTITPTSTPDYPDVTVKMQANCRYGPGTAYLYRWGLYPGDTADVRGRNWDGSWWWIHPSNLPPKQNCWASKIVFNETIDPATVHFVQVALPHTTFAGPPENVQATRSGNQVTVTWNAVPLSDDKRRGYLLEIQACESTMNYPLIVQTDETAYTIRDDQDCKEKASGLLYTAEKHGYSDPVQIPWP